MWHRRKTSISNFIPISYTFLVLMLVFVAGPRLVQADTTVMCQGLVKEYGMALVERRELLFLYQTKMLTEEKLMRIENRIEVVESTLDSILQQHKEFCRGDNT